MAHLWFQVNRIPEKVFKKFKEQNHQDQEPENHQQGESLEPPTCRQNIFRKYD